MKIKLINFQPFHRFSICLTIANIDHFNKCYLQYTILNRCICTFRYKIMYEWEMELNVNTKFGKWILYSQIFSRTYNSVLTSQNSSWIKLKGYTNRSGFTVSILVSESMGQINSCCSCSAINKVTSEINLAPRVEKTACNVI